MERRGARMGKLRVGVIGLGMGRGHIKGYKTHPDCEVVAVCDTDSSRLKWVGDEFGIANRYTSSKEMFAKERLDVVSVATPNKFHMPLTLEAIKAGAHVLCEKPMAMNAGEARKMLAAARKAGRRLMINFSYRFNAMSQALKSQVESGILGEVYFARSVWHRRWGFPRMGSWFGVKELSGGGPLIDLGVHRMDLALWLMGYPQPKTILGAAYDRLARPAADAAKAKYDCEDFAVGLIRFAGGATVELEASWAAHRPEPEFMETRIFGSKGGLVQKNVGGGYNFEAELFTTENGYRFDKKLAAANQPVPSAMEHFVESIRTDSPHMATGEEGVKVMQILDGIYESAKTGKAVEAG